MSLKNLDPWKKAPKWKPKNMADLVCTSLTLLAVHGFVSWGEDEKIKSRIKKWVEAWRN